MKDLKMNWRITVILHKKFDLSRILELGKKIRLLIWRSMNYSEFLIGDWVYSDISNIKNQSNVFE